MAMEMDQDLLQRWNAQFVFLPGKPAYSQTIKGP
jgi:hypothetical protein